MRARSLAILLLLGALAIPSSQGAQCFPDMPGARFELKNEESIAKTIRPYAYDGIKATIFFSSGDLGVMNGGHGQGIISLVMSNARDEVVHEVHIHDSGNGPIVSTNAASVHSAGTACGAYGFYEVNIPADHGNDYQLVVAQGSNDDRTVIVYLEGISQRGTSPTTADFFDHTSVDCDLRAEVLAPQIGALALMGCTRTWIAGADTYHSIHVERAKDEHHRYALTHEGEPAPFECSDRGCRIDARAQPGTWTFNAPYYVDGVGLAPFSQGGPAFYGLIFGS